MEGDGVPSPVPLTPRRHAAVVAAVAAVLNMMATTVAMCAERANATGRLQQQAGLYECTANLAGHRRTLSWGLRALRQGGSSVGHRETRARGTRRHGRDAGDNDGCTALLAWRGEVGSYR